jgi:hypothetical protein
MRGRDSGKAERAQRILVERAKLPLVDLERAGPSALVGRRGHSHQDALLPPGYLIEGCEHFTHCRHIAGLEDWQRMTCAPCSLFRVTVAKLIAISKGERVAPAVAAQELTRRELELGKQRRELEAWSDQRERLLADNESLRAGLREVQEPKGLGDTVEVLQKEIDRLRREKKGLKTSVTVQKQRADKLEKERDDALLQLEARAAKVAIKRSAAKRKAKTKPAKKTKKVRKKTKNGTPKRPPVKFNW